MAKRKEIFESSVSAALLRACGLRPGCMVSQQFMRKRYSELSWLLGDEPGSIVITGARECVSEGRPVIILGGMTYEEYLLMSKAGEHDACIIFLT